MPQEYTVELLVCVLLLVITQCEGSVSQGLDPDLVETRCFPISGICVTVKGIAASAFQATSASPFIPAVSAVGCLETFSITFSKNSTIAAPLTTTDIMLCSSRECKTGKASGVGTIWQKGFDFARSCCKSPAQGRDNLCDSAKQFVSKPLNSYTCALFNANQTAAGIETIVEYIPPLTSDLTNNGVTELCFCTGINCPSVVDPICIMFQIQHCSSCLTSGAAENSLAAVAKLKGTHWTQIYSSNQEISGDPDNIPLGQLIRLGPTYAVAQGDTLMSIALKFGVSVNQLLTWNQHLLDLPDINPRSAVHMSRNVKPGDWLCILPKTCYNSFGSKQPVFQLSEGGDGVSRPTGGSWSDPYQVAPPSP